MYNLKQEQNRERKGSISYTLSDRKYFGSNIENIMDNGKGFYSNVHYSIFGKFK